MKDKKRTLYIVERDNIELVFYQNNSSNNLRELNCFGLARAKLFHIWPYN